MVIGAIQRCDCQQGVDASFESTAPLSVPHQDSVTVMEREFALGGNNDYKKQIEHSFTETSHYSLYLDLSEAREVCGDIQKDFGTSLFR